MTGKPMASRPDDGWQAGGAPPIAARPRAADDTLGAAEDTSPHRLGVTDTLGDSADAAGEVAADRHVPEPDSLGG